MADDSDHVLDKVDALVHELLGPEEMERVERHCGACPDCGRALEAARRRLQNLQTLPPAAASEELILRTERRLDGPARRWPRRLWSGRAVAAAAVLLIALTAVGQWYLESMTAPCYHLSVLGQTRLPAGAESSLRVIVTEASLGMPLGFVPVEVGLTSKRTGQYVQLTQFQTDLYGSGCPRFRLPDWQEADCELSVVARPKGTTAETRRTVQLRRSSQVILSTDRPVYRPGQTVLFRGLALRQSDSRPVGGEKAVFSVTDPKGNTVFQEEKSTSRFGISSAELPLAEEITEGTYRLECRVGESTGSTSVEVKKYSLPKFKVAVTTDRDAYEPGAPVRVKVRADYFFGKPVADATVGVEVRMSDEPDSRRGHVTARTDASGVAELQFQAPTAHAVIPGERILEVALHVRVTDSAGQQEGASVSRPVTDQPFRIEVIPEAGRPARGVTNTVYLMTLYPDGRPAPTELEVEGFQEKLRTDRFGVATLSVRPPDLGDVSLKIRATDLAGRSRQREAKLAFDDRGEQYLFRTDKAVYDRGETMHVTVRGEQGIVFFDLLKGGQLLQTGSVGVSRGRGECSVDLPRDATGPLVLSSYYFGDPRPSGERTHLIYVRPGRTIDVRAEADRTEYRPGQLARVSLRVKDPAGKPAPGGLSLVAVDESVYSLSGQAAEDSPALSGWERSRLQAVRTLYPSWSPDDPPAGPGNDRVRLEQALFAAASRRGGESEQDSLRQQLLPFLEGSDRSFQVFDRPDWKELASNLNLPPELLAELRNDTPLSLQALGYSDNYLRVEAQRKTGLQLVGWLWTGYAWVAGVGVLVWLLSKTRHCLEAVVVVGITVVLIGLLMPAVQKVREASPRTQAMNDLKQIELAIYNYREANGKMPGESGAASGGPRVRQWFPETLLWRPEVITDDDGRAEVEVPLADSITDWRLTASAVTADGRLGSARTKLRVFQPFFVDVSPPPALTRGDEVAFPVVVYNYLEKPQTVTVTLEDAGWFERSGEATRTTELAAGEVRSLSFRVRALRVGQHDLQVTAKGEGGGDAIRRKVEVLPDGPRTENVVNGNLREPADIDLTVPEDTIDGSVKVLLRLYPSSFSQLLEGLDGILQLPYGCFEQTSSVTYPNVLALDYLRRTGRANPEVEAKARKYIQLGYQRLLTFEVSGGGFDWFGRAPANRTVTAYGLMEFADMARVHDVDSKLVARTRKWLLDQRQPDGTWQPEAHQFMGGPAGDRPERARLCATAYVAAAVFADGREPDQSGQTRDYLLRHDPASLRDPYALALVCNALLEIEPQGQSALPYLAALREMARSSGDGKFTLWEREPGSRTTFYGAGRCGDVETTALACLALLKGGQRPETVRGSLAWLVARRDGHGTWGSTQATILALKALLAGTRDSGGKDAERRVEVALDGKSVQELVIPADQAQVMKQVNLAPLVSRGRHRLRLTDRGHTAVDYQVAFSYHTPSISGKDRETLGLQVSYDRLQLRAGEYATAVAAVTNRRAEPVPMVMVELAVPPAITHEESDLAKLVEAGLVAKFQQTPRNTLLYLRSLDPGQTVKLKYRLRATMPGTVTAPPTLAYEYYDPRRVSRTDAIRLHVTAAE
jgi:hypothetical protein